MVCCTLIKLMGLSSGKVIKLSNGVSSIGFSLLLNYTKLNSISIKLLRINAKQNYSLYSKMLIQWRWKTILALLKIYKKVTVLEGGLLVEWDIYSWTIFKRNNQKTIIRY